MMDIDKNSFDLVCIGEANIDIFCNQLVEIPNSGQWVVVGDITSYPGGCPTNTAIVASKFGLKTSLISAIGDDIWSNILLDELNRLKVNTSNIKRVQNCNTGKTVVLNIKDKDRAMIHDNGANVMLDVSCIDKKVISSAKSILLSSYISGLPELYRSDAIKIFSFLKSMGKLTFLDVLIDPFTENPMSYLEGLLDYTDYLIINIDEGEMLTGYYDYREQAKALLKRGANNLIIKLGKNGSYFCSKDVELREDPYEDGIEVIDPTGSGDAFNAGVIYSCLQHWGMKKVLQFSNIAGASAVTKIGCTPGIYSLEKIENIMKIKGQ